MESSGYQPAFQYDLLNFGDPGLAPSAAPLLPDMLTAGVSMPTSQQALSGALVHHPDGSLLQPMAPQPVTMVQPMAPLPDRMGQSIAPAPDMVQSLAPSPDTMIHSMTPAPDGTMMQPMAPPPVSLVQTMAPPPSTPSTSLVQTVVTPSGGLTSSEGETSFNDSGYFSPQAPPFTLLANQARGSGSGQQALAFGRSPSRSMGSKLNSLVGAPRPSWQEDFPNMDDWDSNFITNFEENLFGFDAADLNSMVEGILGSPFKSPGSSPYDSPRAGRGGSVMSGLRTSPFTNLSTSNVMLAAMRRSPARAAGGSPFRKLFSTPSPVKGFSGHNRSSPSTRQRRLVLHSPGQRPDSLSDSLLDLPSFLYDIKEEAEQDDLGVTPFQRTNSLGFSPTHDAPSSPPFSGLYADSSAPSAPPLSSEDTSVSLNPGPGPQKLQEIHNVMALRQPHRERDSAHHPYRAPAARHNHKLRSSPSSHKSAGDLSQGRISVTRHSHPVTNLNSKDTLRLVRARFTEALEKASADAALKEKRLQSRMKTKARRQLPCSDLPHTRSVAVETTGKAEMVVSGGVGYARVQSEGVVSGSARRRQEILPKPDSSEWPRRQPCKIAPKKRKR